MENLDTATRDQLQKIGEKIKQLRVDANKGSYETFAFDNGMSRATVYRVEAGTHNYSIDTLIKILAVYNLTVEEFFKGV